MSKHTVFLFYLTAFLLIAGLITYSYITIKLDDISIEEFIDDPGAADGIHVVVAGNLINKSDGSFFILTNEMPLEIRYTDAAGVSSGLVEIDGTYNADGSIDARGVYTYKYNRYIYLVSAIAFLIFLFIFFREWDLSWGGFKDA